MPLRGTTVPRRSERRITKRTVDALTVGEKDTVFWDRDLAGLWRARPCHRPQDLRRANATLRPYLYVHKGATQGFLDLFRAWFNLRTRRWGRHKGTSAHECLTRQRVHDWLTLLGYPPSPTLN